MAPPTILWFRRDLRLADQAALVAAAASGPVIPVYILDDETPRHRAMGGASRWWLHHSLARLDENLCARGSRLILRRGKCEEELAKIAEESGAGAVHCLRHYEPWWRNAERAVAKRLDLICHDGNYLAPPGSVKTGSGGLYKIYTPSGARCASYAAACPLGCARRPRCARPLARPGPAGRLETAAVPAQLGDGVRRRMDAGRNGRAGATRRFAEIAARYDEQRNLPAIEGSSRLSPHLHFGEVSPAAIWHAVADAGDRSMCSSPRSGGATMRRR